MQSHILPELRAIYRQWFVWLTLASQDIKLRYRRSVLGPLWITISMAVTIYSMGFLYGKLFHIELKTYFPYLASGIIGWSFISSLLLESGQVFIESEGYIRNQESYISMFLMRLIFRNILVFMHNILVFVPIIIFFKVQINLKILLLIPGILLIAINAFFYGTVLAIISTRYRDFAQIVASIVQVVFFLTPVMWMADALSENLHWIVDYNPFNQFLNLIRIPLLHREFTAHGMLMVMGMTVFGMSLYAILLGRYKHRIVFWL